MEPIVGDVYRFLGSIPPFQALPPEDLRRVAAEVRPRAFSKGEAVYNEGDAADSVWIVYKGRVDVLRCGARSKVLAVESLVPGEIFGAYCRLNDWSKAYPCTAVAKEPTVALRLPDRVFSDVFSRDAGFARQTCSLCARRLTEIQESFLMGRERASVRIASLLLRLSRIYGPILSFTKKEISELVGTTIVTTFRVFARFRRKKFVRSLRGQIHVKNPEGLRSFIDQS